MARLPALPGDLAAVRTILAADRTLMAWIRTSLSMLSFVGSPGTELEFAL